MTLARAARDLSRPMTSLAAAADRVARGQLDAAVPRVLGPVEMVGLGESIDQMRLETRRELLWFGCAATPDWATPTTAPLPLLTRSYRVILGASPTILISESFPLDDPTSVG